MADTIANKHYPECSQYLTTEHLAWILNTQREFHRLGIKAWEVQERLDAKFPPEEHVALWETLLSHIGA